MSNLGGSNNLNRMKNLMGAFYGVGSRAEEDTQVEVEANTTNLESAHFQVNQYIKDRLKSLPYTRLLDEEENVKLGIVHLDESMQQLVYDNYSKFIGATDTMQNMKEKLVNMESQVAGLETKMEAISITTKRMSERNSTKRNQLARLDRLASVVGNLSALFELPKKLRLATKVEELQVLVRTYKSAKPFLEKRRDVPSFSKIALSCEEASKEIYSRLSVQRTEGLSVAQFNATISILLDLSPPFPLETEEGEEKTDPLAKMFFEWHQDQIAASGVSKEQIVELDFEPAVQRVKITVLEPLRLALLQGEENFPGHDLGPKLARDVVRLALDRVRCRFDIEPCSFVTDDDSREESSDGVIQALQFAMQEFVLFEQSLALPKMKLNDRIQELAERVLRRQVDLTMFELKDRAERAVRRLDRADVESSRRTMDDVVETIVGDVQSSQLHLAKLLNKASAVVSHDILVIFEDVLQANMQQWVVWLGERLCELEESSLLQALVAKSLSTRVGDFNVQDVKSAAKSLKNAGEDALKAFCSFKGRTLAKSMIPSSDADFKAIKVSDGAVRLLNATLELGPMLKQVGIPLKASRASAAIAAVANRFNHQSSTSDSAVQRLFSEKIVVFDYVEFDGPAIFAAIFRVGLKTLFEYLREDVITKQAFHQVQADAAFLRKFVSALTGEHAPSVIKLLEEVVHSAKERCVDPSPLEPFMIDAMFTERRDEVLLKMLD
ncbi:hypothetical protein BASA81_002270 [Batrachochytrium salamandrivorans]|nr:hypothetical protein BASA81_002270 [Batrachochytrium salamandrivorans]